MLKLDTKTGRERLKPQREPYWHRVRRNFHFGFRRLESGGTWIARYRDEDKSKRSFKALGDATETNTYDVALKAAEEWVAEIERGIGATRPGHSAIVADACREYVEALRRDQRPEAAHDADMRFCRTVYGDPKSGRAAHSIARRELSKLHDRHISEWRDSLVIEGLSKGSTNRTLTALKAALNKAVELRIAGAQLALECRRVKSFKNAGRRRDLFLDRDQRKRLVAAANGALRDLIEAAALTGARPGELVKVRRAAFDARRHSITFSGKTGARTVPLSPPAIELFTRLSKDVLPQAHLLRRDDGQPWAHSDWDELVREAAKQAGVPGTVLYTLRHSHITELLLGGMATLEVSRLVGTSLAMIEKHYGHLVANVARERLASIKIL